MEAIRVQYASWILIVFDWLMTVNARVFLKILSDIYIESD